MSDQPNIGSAIGGIITDTRLQLERLPPHRSSALRAVYGAQLLCAAWCFRAHVPPPLFLGAAVVGFVMLVAGLRTARGPASVWSLAVPAFGAWAVVHWVPGLWQDGFGRGLCLVFLSGAAVRLLIALRGPGPGARDLVQAEIDNSEFRW
jgi:hypothetical protein